MHGTHPLIPMPTSKTARKGTTASRKKAPPNKTAKPARAKPAPKPAAAPAPTPAPTPARNPWGDAQAKLDAFGEDTVRARFVDGKLIAEVAAEAGVSSGALLAWLTTTPERLARAREAREVGAAVLEEKAQRGIEEAKTAFDLQKARELAHHLRWKASKLNPRQFGDKLALGAAEGLPPLPPPAAPAQVSVSFEVSPGDAYKNMLVRA